MGTTNGNGDVPEVAAESDGEIVDSTPARIVTGGAAVDRDTDGMPPDDELIPRAEALRILRVSHSMLARMVSRHELRRWMRGRDAFYERAEVEALAGGSGGGESVVREATALLRQAHAHQDALAKLLIDGAAGYAKQSQAVIDRLLSRNEQLEQQLWELRDKAAQLARDEAGTALAVMQAEDEVNRKASLRRTLESTVPVLIAQFTGKGEAKDAAIAAGVRALVSDAATVEALRAALPAEKRAIVDALLTAATPDKPTDSQGGQGEAG